MKYLSLPIFLFCAIFSIKGQSAKIKIDNVVFKYDFYPEIGGFEDYRSFIIDIKDKRNVSYTYTEGDNINGSKADIQNGFGASNLRWNFAKYNLFIEVIQTSSTPNNDEVISYQDPATKAFKYAYKLSAKQTYTIRLLDAKNGNKLITEFNTECNSETAFPGYPSATIGFNSPQLLSDNYLRTQEKVEGHYKAMEANLIKYALTRKIFKEIEPKIHEDWVKLNLITARVKTKDTKFQLLDSAAIYMEQGMEEISLNKKASIKGGHHLLNAKNKFLKAHQIFLAYNTSEYIDWFTDSELKEEYVYGMKTNLYFINFLLADYTKTNEIYQEVYSIVEEEKKKIDPTDYKALFKNSSAVKTLAAMDILRAYELREVKFSETFKERYKY